MACATEAQAGAVAGADAAAGAATPAPAAPAPRTGRRAGASQRRRPRRRRRRRPPPAAAAAGRRRAGRRRRRTRRSAAASAAAAARGHAAAGHADRVGDGADARSARRPRGRALGRRRRRPGTCGSSRPRRRREKFLGVTNSDLAFTGKYVIQGNYNGFQIFDISNPAKPALVADLSSARRRRATCRSTRTCCSSRAKARPAASTAASRACPSRSARIACAASASSTSRTSTHPKYVDERADLPRLAHAHGRDAIRTTRTTSTSTSRARRASARRTSCRAARTVRSTIPNTARFRLEVIKVPLAAPQKAAIVSSPRIFAGLAPPPRRVEPGRGGAGRAGRGGWRGRCGRRGRRRRRTAGWSRGLPAGAAPRRGRADAAARRRPRQHRSESVPRHHGVSRDRPRRRRVRRLRPAARHPRRRATRCASTRPPTSTCRSGTRRRSTTTARKILFSDEWGGGTQPRCRDTDKLEWGANALFTIENGTRCTFKSYYKMPAPQTSFENCVAHNGSLIPIPGREVMVQGWYQGGISVFDWTDVGEAEGDRVLRSRPGRRDAADHRRLVVGLLVQRLDRQLRDRARPRHLRAAAERPHLAERDRRGQDRAVRLPERAGAAQVRVAAELRQGARVSRSARALQGPRRGEDQRRARRSCRAPKSCRAARGSRRSRRWPRG